MSLWPLRRVSKQFIIYIRKAHCFVTRKMQASEPEVKVKQTLYRPWQGLRVPGVWGHQISRQSAHKVVRLSAPHTGRIPPPGNIPGTNLKDTAAGRIISMNNSNDTIGNRTRELSACSTVPQLTGPTRGAGKIMSIKNSNDTIGNRNREISPCSTVRHRAPPRAL